MTATARREERASELRGHYGVRTTLSNAEAAAGAGLVVIAVKPQDFDGLLGEVGPALAPGQTVLSVAAELTSPAESIQTRTIAAWRKNPGSIGKRPAVFLMQAFGFTLNLLTLLAIVLSVGLVVDDAIVVVENVERHIHEGRTPYHAALIGARELVGPVIAMTITLAAVYVPIGIQGGLTGALFREFAFTLAGAVFISGVVALTLSPVMSSRLLRAEHQHRWFARKVEGAFDAVRTRYSKMLAGTLRFRPAVCRSSRSRCAPRLRRRR